MGYNNKVKGLIAGRKTDPSAQRKETSTEKKVGIPNNLSDLRGELNGPMPFREGKNKSLGVGEET